MASNANTEQGRPRVAPDASGRRTFSTANQAKALRPASSRYDARDSETEGLELRVYPTGARVWTYRYQLAGRQRRVKLGVFGEHPGELTLSAARAKAAQASGRVASGEDVAEVAQRRRREAQDATTVATLAARWLADCERRLRPATMREYRRKLAVEIIPALGTRPARDVDRASVVRLLEQVRDRRGAVTANRTRALLAAMFSFAAERGEVPANPATSLPRSVRARESPRQRVLADEEIAALWAALEEMDATSPGVADAWRLILLTAARPGEVLGMCWSDLVRQRDGVWWNLSERQTKQRRAHRYPLSPQALAIVEKWRPLTGRSPWVLPSRTEGQPLAWLSHSAQRLRERTKLPRFTAHDMRRTAGTILRRDLGQAAELVEDLLGHSRGRLQQVYQVEKDERAMRRAAELLGEHVMAAAMRQERAAQVVPHVRQAQRRQS